MRLDTGDFNRFARSAHAAARLLERAVDQLPRDVAQESGHDVVVAGARPMPARGGLRAHLEQAGFTVTGNGPQALLQITSDVNLGSLNDGLLEHPVFQRPGRRTAWVRQRVAAGSWSTAFDTTTRPRAEQALEGLGKRIANQLTRKG